MKTKKKRDQKIVLNLVFISQKLSDFPWLHETTIVGLLFNFYFIVSTTKTKTKFNNCNVTSAKISATGWLVNIQMGHFLKTKMFIGDLGIKLDSWKKSESEKIRKNWKRNENRGFVAAAWWRSVINLFDFSFILFYFFNFYIFTFFLRLKTFFNK